MKELEKTYSTIFLIAFAILLWSGSAHEANGQCEEFLQANGDLMVIDSTSTPGIMTQMGLTKGHFIVVVTSEERNDWVMDQLSQRDIAVNLIGREKQAYRVIAKLFYDQKGSSQYGGALAATPTPVEGLYAAGITDISSGQHRQWIINGRLINRMLGCLVESQAGSMEK